ncbi:TPA: methyltransferase, partial [archaeon]|nr:methyltransferase [Candidatus Naiadarchaeales archaeon SRR2090159.bin1288]
KVTAIDLNEDAIECAKKNWENNKGLRNQGHRGSETKTRTEPLKSVPLSPFINFIVGNLFAPVKGEKFDLIIFNPPYLPKEEKYTEKKIDLSYNSAETLERFLKEYKKHLNKNGRALIINSSISGVKVEGKVIAEKKLAFEKLEVIMLQ